MALMPTRTPLVKNILPTSLVVGSRLLLPDVPEVTPNWYGSFTVRTFFLPQEICSTKTVWQQQSLNKFINDIIMCYLEMKGSLQKDFLVGYKIRNKLTSRASKAWSWRIAWFTTFFSPFN